MKLGFFFSAMIMACALVALPATAKTKKSKSHKKVTAAVSYRAPVARKSTQKKATARARAATDKEPTSSYYSLLRFYPYPDRSPGGTENWLRNESAKQDYDGYEAWDSSVMQRQNQITAIPSMGIYR